MDIVPATSHASSHLSLLWGLVRRIARVGEYITIKSQENRTYIGGQCGGTWMMEDGVQ